MSTDDIDLYKTYTNWIKDAGPDGITVDKLTAYAADAFASRGITQKPTVTLNVLAGLARQGVVVVKHEDGDEDVYVHYLGGPAWKGWSYTTHPDAVDIINKVRAGYPNADDPEVNAGLLLLCTAYDGQLLRNRDIASKIVPDGDTVRIAWRDVIREGRDMDSPINPRGRNSQCSGLLVQIAAALATRQFTTYEIEVLQGVLDTIPRGRTNPVPAASHVTGQNSGQ